MRIAREEIFGPVLTMLTFRTPDEAVAKANNTPYGLSAGVWTEKGSRAMGMAAALRAGVVWDNTFNRFDPAAASAATRSPGSAGRAARPGWRAYLDTDDEADVRAMSAPAPVAKTYKLYIGGAFPRSESGRGPIRALDAKGGVPGQRALALPQGRPGRGRGRPQGFRRLVEGDAVQPRPGDLPDRRDAGGPAGASSSSCSDQWRRVQDGGRGRGRRRDRPAGALRRLDRQAGRGLRRRQPGLRAVLLLLRPEPTGVVAVAGARPDRRCSAWCR